MRQGQFSRRGFLRRFGLVSAAGVMGVSAGCESAEPTTAAKSPSAKRLPNIVLVFCDDLGYGDVGCYGAKGFTTPHLDAMAKGGMRFTDFYAGMAVCSASRSSLMTGCYPIRVGITGALMPGSKTGLNSSEQTIAELLKTQGYATGIFGKWHLGHQKQFLPLQHGFDEYYGLPYSNDMWPVDFDGKPYPKDSKSWRAKAFPILPLIEGNKTIGHVKNHADQDKLTTAYTERACAFIRKNKDNPFFCYLPHSMPHVPLGVSKKFRGKSKQGMYGDVVMEIDWSVGQLQKTIRECGLENDTLVIFTSDNGPWLNYGNHAGSTGGLREGKGTSFEGGQREPCIAYWPGKIKAGSTCAKLASTIDFLPTFSKLTGAPLPKNKIDGVDISGLLLGTPNANPRRRFYFYYGWKFEGVREGKWKLHFPHTHRSYVGKDPGMDGHPGHTSRVKIDWSLYDLETDPQEKTNLLEDYPDVVARLKKLGQACIADLGDVSNGKRVVGRGQRSPGRMPSKPKSKSKPKT